VKDDNYIPDEDMELTNKDNAILLVKGIDRNMLEKIGLDKSKRK